MTFFLILSFYLGSGEGALNPNNLVAMASRAFDNGLGKAYIAQESGLRQAGNLVGPRFESLSLNVVPEMNADGGRGEHNLQLEVQMPLANLPKARRDVFEARANQIGQAASVSKMAFLHEVRRHYQAAALAHTLEIHVTHLHEQCSEEAKVLQEGLEQGLVSRADWLSLEAQKGEFAHEIAQMKSRRLEAMGHLQQLLGQSLDIAFPDFSMEMLSENNPFNDLAAMESPEIRHAVSASHQANAKARLSLAERSLDLAPNLNYRDDPDGEQWIGFGLKLSKPLGPKKGSAWAEARAEADAWDARMRWLKRQRADEIDIRSRSYEQRKLQVAAYKTSVLDVLEEKVALYREGVRQGHLDRQIYHLANQNLHEVEHTWLEMVVELWGDELEARILKSLSGVEGK